MIETKESEPEVVYTTEMEEAFYVEELEDRFEMASSLAPAPNGVCWISQL